MLEWRASGVPDKQLQRDFDRNVLLGGFYRLMLASIARCAAAYFVDMDRGESRMISCFHSYSRYRRNEKIVQFIRVIVIVGRE